MHEEDAREQPQQLQTASPPKPEAPSLTTAGNQLKVSWVIPEVDPPVTTVSVGLRRVGEKDWQLVSIDQDKGRCVLVPTGGNGIGTSVTTVQVDPDQPGTTWEAMVAMQSSAGNGEWSAASASAAIPGLPSSKEPASAASTTTSPSIKSLEATKDTEESSATSASAEAKAEEEPLKKVDLRATPGVENGNSDLPKGMSGDVKKAWTDPDAEKDQKSPTEPTPQEQECPAEEKIPLSKRIIFSAPTMATIPFVVMFSIHGNKNYESFGASLAMIALFTALARSLDVVSDPLMSYITDSANCDKLPAWLRGRRKPFMFFGCFMYSGLLWLLLNPPYASVTRLSVWFGMCYTLYFLSNTFTTIPYDALAPELSEDSRERTKLFFVANLFDGIGTLVALGLPSIFTMFSTSVWTERNGDICQSELDAGTMCLSGRSCGTFMTTGFDGAFQANVSLAESMSNISSHAVPQDTARLCLAWLTSKSADRVVLVNASAGQNDEFCYCFNECSDACDVANKRTGFMMVGYCFAIWFVVSMVVAVVCIKERPPPPADKRPEAPPIVPSMKSALTNRLFMILLPAWVCDAFVTAISQSLVPFFVEAVVAPAFMTKQDHGRDCAPSDPDYEGGKWLGEASIADHPTYDPLCKTENVITVCGLLALVVAILVLPLWNLLVRKIGKVRTWFMWSLSMAVTNVCFLFMWKGAVFPLFVVCAINGAPLGAKFLADAILADIIDYDEFLTGMRSEATYFMFKSFLPKIVQIPATAIPIALLGAFSYRKPIGGRPQEQPDSVAHYIKCVVGLGFLCSLLAYKLKAKYPLRQEKVPELAEALKEHKKGRWARDPISEKFYKPMAISCSTEQKAFWLFNHFAVSELLVLTSQPESQSAHQGNEPEKETNDIDLKKTEERDTARRDAFHKGCQQLKRRTRNHIIAAVTWLVSALIGAGASMQLLDNERWQFVPTLFTVCIGLGISSTAFTCLRHKAAKELDHISVQALDNHECYEEKVQQLLAHQAKLAKMGRRPRTLSVFEAAPPEDDADSPTSAPKKDHPD